MSAAVVSATLVDELQPTPSAIAMYQDGRLALTAEDVPLGDILERIGESTGAVIEAPVLEERVSVQLDPQPPVQAIAALFEAMGAVGQLPPFMAAWSPDAIFGFLALYFYLRMPT